jgi:hypothetical protein
MIVSIKVGPHLDRAAHELSAAARDSAGNVKLTDLKPGLVLSQEYDLSHTVLLNAFRRTQLSNGNDRSQTRSTLYESVASIMP